MLSYVDTCFLMTHESQAFPLQLKASVEKGRKWRFEVKIKIGAIQLNTGTQPGFHVRNIVVDLFLDLRASFKELAY